MMIVVHDSTALPSAGDEGGALRRLLRDPSAIFGVAVLVILALLFLIGPWLTPYGFAEQHIAVRLQGPSLAHPLGTDQLGRDLLARIIYGVRIELMVAVPAVFGGLVLGLCLGLPAGYLGGRVDALIVMILDTLHAMPTVVLAMILLALIGNSLPNVVIVLIVSLAPSFARVARASVFAVKHSAYVEAEVILGASTHRIVLRHVLPNILPPLLLLVAMNLPTAIAVETGLSFLGLGVRPPTPSWGVIMADGFQRVRTAPWAVLWTCLALGITTLGCTLIGERLRDLFDPKLQGSGK
jgi:peptide/nickel transport system permease protein